MADCEQPWESDAELVEEILAGSIDHFNLLYETYFSRVYRFALKRLRDPGEAEDVAQEVFLNLHRNGHRFRKEARFSTFVYRVAANAALNRRRRFRMPPA